MLTPYGCSSCQQSNSLLDLVKVFARKYNQLHTDWLPCQNNMKNSKNIGLTINQIKKSNELKNKKSSNGVTSATIFVQVSDMAAKFR